KYNPGNYTMSPLAAFAEIEEIYIELSKIGLVKIVNKSN
ncbi:TPA: ribosome-binding factor A, partial [Streptococcus pneumoniae]|nr:ribosome-binding factor A [Streptococcus pneumoniae]